MSNGIGTEDPENRLVIQSEGNVGLYVEPNCMLYITTENQPAIYQAELHPCPSPRLRVAPGVGEGVVQIRGEEGLETLTSWVRDAWAKNEPLRIQCRELVFEKEND